MVFDDKLLATTSFNGTTAQSEGLKNAAQSESLMQQSPSFSGSQARLMLGAIVLRKIINEVKNFILVH